MVTPPALPLGDDDTTPNDVVAICLRLAVLHYDIRLKPDTFTGIESSIQVSLISRKSDRLVKESVEMSSECTTKICALMAGISNSTLIRNTIQKLFTLATSVGNGCWANLWYSSRTHSNLKSFRILVI
ncbi:hypothetical protein TNCT_698561 [Trichonephila clavata]|uniref:Uncharacterized protein n=1 Tax=Trichonephila clavata TaxID=2740835 RepID=A0A8X6FFJ8_TRICU|nr:hypothetical protein TNCT_698561 [Trichonephila clavata]